MNTYRSDVTETTNATEVEVSHTYNGNREAIKATLLKSV